MLILYVPYILIVLFLLGVVLLVSRKWRAAIVILFVAFVWNIWTESIPLNLLAGSKQGAITVMTWNLNSSDLGVKDSTDWDKAAKVILRQNADILCLQEYDTLRCSRLSEILSRHYPYMLTMRMRGDNVMFSKEPLEEAETMTIDTTGILEEGSKGRLLREAQRRDLDLEVSTNRLVMWTAIKVNERIVKVMNCHLASNHYDMQRIAMADTVEWIDGVPTYLRNIKRGRLQRMAEAIGIGEILKGGSEPVIVCGDMNELSGGDVLNRLQKENGLRDAWWKGGFGPGFTYHGHKVMHFRLDHVLYNDGLKLKGIRIVNQELSDHQPMVASFDIN